MLPNCTPTLPHPTLPQVLREVTTLARLDHPNVIRYNAAWLEWTSASLDRFSQRGAGGKGKGKPR